MQDKDITKTLTPLFGIWIRIPRPSGSYSTVYIVHIFIRIRWSSRYNPCSEYGS